MTQHSVIEFPMDRFFGNIHYIRVRRQNPSGDLVVDVRALGSFAPRALDAMQVEFVVAKLDDTRVSIRGKLSAIPSEHPRGTHIHFTFTPKDPEQLTHVRFHGRNEFSNVRSMLFSSRGAFCCIRNSFYKEPETPPSSKGSP